MQPAVRAAVLLAERFSDDDRRHSSRQTAKRVLEHVRRRYGPEPASARQAPADVARKVLSNAEEDRQAPVEREADELERDRVRPEHPHRVEPVQLRRERATGPGEPAGERTDRRDPRVVRQRDEARPAREGVRRAAGRRVEASEQDELVDPLA